MLFVKTEVPSGDVNSLLAWIVGILTSFITGILIYLRSQNKERIDDLKEEVKDLKLKYNTEIEYSKNQDRANVKLLTDTGNILDSSVKKLENNSEILRDNSEVLRNIKNLQVAIEDQIKTIKYHESGK